jgi:hypothetical protein
MDVANQPTPPPRASLEGVGRGLYKGFVKFDDAAEIKIFLLTMDLF